MQKISLKLAALAIASVMFVPLAAAEPPANDEESGAELWITLLGPATADTREATHDASETTDDCHMGRTVWFTAVVVAPGTINTEGSNFDTKLAVYDSNGALVACDDDSGSGLLSEAAIDAPGIYTIRAGGYYSSWTGGASGDLVLNSA